MKRWAMTVLAVIAGCGLAAAGPAWGPIGSVEGALHGGATHMLEINYGDLTISSTNTAQVFTNALTAGTGFEVIGAVLDTAFDTASTSLTSSLTLQIGTPADADQFLESMELAGDGTEVFAKFGRLDAGSITVTKQTITAPVVTGLVYEVESITGTNMIKTITSYTNSIAIVTNVTASYSPANAFGSVYFATATNILATVTPDANQAVSSHTKGKVRVYMRQWGSGK